jgi:hypothetical protein
MDSSPNMLNAGHGYLEADSGRKVMSRSGETTAAFETLTGPGFPAAPRSLLIQIIEGEIIPRLFLAHRAAQTERTAAPPPAAEEEAVTSEYLARLFLDGAQADIVRRLQGLLDDGMEREKIYLELLASVPRTLTDLWEKGSCTFDSMSRGLSCLDLVLVEMHERERTTATTF